MIQPDESFQRAARKGFLKRRLRAEAMLVINTLDGRAIGAERGEVRGRADPPWGLDQDVAVGQDGRTTRSLSAGVRSRRTTVATIRPRSWSAAPNAPTRLREVAESRTAAWSAPFDSMHPFHKL